MNNKACCDFRRHMDEMLEIWEKIGFKNENKGEEVNDKKMDKYNRKCKSEIIDVYDVLKAFEVYNPASQHAIKKLLASGKRGYKDVKQDLEEAKASIDRAIELENWLD